MQLSGCLLFAFLTVARSQECYDDGNEFCIDENDILSADLLPGSFLLMDQTYHLQNLSRSTDDNSIDGSPETAFDEMEFHRKKMNEFLLHEYMAEEILKGMYFTKSIRVKRKNDASSASFLTDFLDAPNVTAYDKLRADEGSKYYKQWLNRPTTLEDVYRHIDATKNIQKKHEVYESDPDGEIEGELMVMKTPVSQGKIGRPPHMDPFISSSTGHFPSYDWPMSHPPIQHSVEHIHVHSPPYEEEHYHEPIYHSKGKGHELTITDFFEIALTALAFLAFGLFVIQLLMNITAPAMATTTTAQTILADFDTRFKREALYTPPLSYTSNEEVNELAERVLRSIEAVLVAQSDNGNCLRRLLCEDNRFSRDTENGHRIWIPVWSLGMSWASSRVLTRRPWSAMLDSVKASVLGLGKADCATLYPDCELGRERIKRRRRRRKR
ncbi:uncharacterized protein LOC131666435 [Phymastichus coffea]|uniref:uncharacterized protein LOC131666435 n=1 Tax=Phymastichus coffea TaxID=108790 RepID=UPI00273BC947|nr:uncharacterized protein LOC131666435 [Phymastichus coffea]